MEQPDYICFLQSVFADGTVGKQTSPAQLLEALKARADYPERLGAFLVTCCDELNELAPIEVLAGERLSERAQTWWFPTEPNERAAKISNRAHARMLDYSLQERMIKVMYAARNHFHPVY